MKLKKNYKPSETLITEKSHEFRNAQMTNTQNVK